ncbi:MAG: lipid A deacylase LpxR family protein [Phycisphaeraceae bacterium]
MREQSDYTFDIHEQSTRPDPYAVTIYWDNDGSILKRNNAQDRHYTNGNAVTVTWQPAWGERFADMAPLGETFHRTAAGFILGHLIFTPEKITARRLQRDDRPYAGYLFTGLYLQRSNDEVFDHAQFDVGIVGPSAYAEQLQEEFHDWLERDQPNGWDNQLKDELTVQLTLRRKWRLDLSDIQISEYRFEQQWIPQVDLAVGSVHRHVCAGGTWRIGHNLPDDFGPGRLADPIDATADVANASGGYVFVRAAGRVVEHDLFLEGNSFKESHGVNAETLVGEVQIGVAAYLRCEGWTLLANYSQTFISEQFQGQRGSDAFGSLVVSAIKTF